MSILVALVMLGSGPEQGDVRPDAEDFPQLACYCPSARKFIKEEKERLSADRTDRTIALWDSDELEKATELLLENLHYIIRILTIKDENLSLDTRNGSWGNSG
jgi:hypothetical protein